MQNSRNKYKLLPLNSFVLHRTFKFVQFSEKLKPLRIDPFKSINKPTEVIFELLTQILKSFHTHRTHLISFYLKEPLLFPHIQSYIEQNPETLLDSDTSDRLLKDLYTSQINSEVDDDVFDDDPFCNEDSDQSIMFDTKLYKPVNLEANHYHLSRIKSGSETLH